MDTTTAQPEVVDLCLQKIKLSIPLLATFYNQGLNDTQIARRCNITQQGVSSYKLKHINTLLPLIYNRDSYNAIDSLYIAQQAKSKLKDILDTCEDFSKKDIIPLVAAADRFTNQERLYSDKSTSNVSVAGISTNIEERKAKREELLRELDSV